MFYIALLLFLACLALFVYQLRRGRKAPSRRLKFGLVASGLAVVFLGAAGAVTYGQLGLISQDARFLNAAIAAYGPVHQAVASSSPKSEPCPRAVAAADGFYSTYATAPTWNRANIYDHSTPAFLAAVTYQALQARGCVTKERVSQVLVSLRAMQRADWVAEPIGVKLLTHVPIALIAPTSLAGSARARWDLLSPHAIASRNCFTALARDGLVTAPSQEQADACNAPVPHVVGYSKS
ncbi:MAG: hypothetical protein EPN36_13945 [Rhodanobacteraceae bacterium]|nr:MAG: hypothetical protein EPN36_13945 [Rhodanobacteraceae bacterium]